MKKVLLINTHLTYPNWAEGKLNNSFFKITKEYENTRILLEVGVFLNKK